MLRTGEVLGSWALDRSVLCGLVLSAAFYLGAARSVSRRHPTQPWPYLHTAWWLTGITLIAIALMGPVGSYDDVFFWAHMIQHMILMMLAAPLLVLGQPVLLALRAVPVRFRRRYLLPLLRSQAIEWLGDPRITWLLFVAVLCGTHFSPFYEFALEHEWAHKYVEHPLYLGVALLYYYPLMGRGPFAQRVRPSHKIVSLLLMMIPEAITGFFIYASPYVLYPHYAAVHRPFGPGALADQQLGGALMWAGSMLLDTGWVALAVRDWLVEDTRKTRRADQQSALAGRA